MLYFLQFTSLSVSVLFICSFCCNIYNKNRPKWALIDVVELPDTASGSELSREHNSTYIVSCFVLADILSCKKPNLKLPWLNFRAAICHFYDLNPVV